LRGRHLPGVRFERSDFTPTAPGDGKYANVAVRGVRVVLDDRDLFDAGRTAAALLWAAARASSDSLVIRAATFDDRFGRPAMREALLRGVDPDSVLRSDAEAVEAWHRRVAPYLLYR
jgi:uncharacterized protein YbbC (DUF1343 family)